MLLNSKTAALLAGAAVALGVVNFSSPKPGGGFRFFSRPVEKAWSRQVEKTLSEPAVPEPEGIAGVYSRAEDGGGGEGGGGGGASKTSTSTSSTSAGAPRTLIPRPRAAAFLAKALDPDDAGAFFYVVHGPAGCGKTTLVRQALREHVAKRGGGSSKEGNGNGDGKAAVAKSWSSSSEEGEKANNDEKTSSSSSSPSLPFGGAAYVDAASSFPLDFGRDLASAIGFTFEEGIRTADRLTKALTGGGARALLSSSSADASAAAAAGSGTPQQRQDS